MIIDCHFHIDEKMLTLEKMIESMDKNKIAKTALIPPMNEPMYHVDSKVQASIHHLFRFLIKNTPAIGFQIYDNLVKDGYFHVSGKAYKILMKPDNQMVADAIQRYPDRFLGWVAVNPLLPNFMDEIESYINNPGFIGVKAHPFMHGYSIKELERVAAYCEEKGKPMIIHLTSEKNSYRFLPETYPKLKVIYAHAGLPFWRSLWNYSKNKENVYVDTSSDYLTPSLVAETVNALGYEKCLYGCDGPYDMTTYNEYDYSVKKRWVEELAISDEEKECILGKNFLKLIR
ncbi:MAG: amidohydrolase family protein [Bacillus sp. (in: Bacteria)]|nr:amidohydrolase family protein [Bacillus sp. (in: firmicutes)]